MRAKEREKYKGVSSDALSNNRESLGLDLSIITDTVGFPIHATRITSENENYVQMLG